MATTSVLDMISRFLASRWAVVILVAALVAIGSYFVAARDAGAREFVAATRGTIEETVSVTGSTRPVSSVSLGFGNGGIIASVTAAVGDTVAEGQVLASLDTGDLSAQVAQAQAKLDGLRAGSRSEDIAISTAALDKAAQDLENAYAGATDASADAFAKANDAIRVQLDDLFLDDEGSAPKLSYIVGPVQIGAAHDAEKLRRPVAALLDEWRLQVARGDRSPAALDALLRDGIARLDTIRRLIDAVSITLDDAPGLSADTRAAYKANTAAALAQANTAAKNLNTVTQGIASQKITVSQSQAQLDLKKAGASPEDIRAQEAQVASAASKLRNSRIVAPISGVVTQFDAKVGQFASPGAPLVSVISDGAFEIEAQVSEIDVAKVAIGNAVSMTFDAFPNETFTGSVFYIDPAQTTTEGVVGYKIKVSFDTPDPRMKSGLTANLDIATRRKENAVTLPQYAILQNDDGSFVQVRDGRGVRDVAVTLGIQDRDGNVEIVSGVAEGQEVLNVGLKTQ